MSHAVDPASFKTALIILAAAGLVIPLFHRLRLSTSLGFILIGIAVGPHALGSIAALSAVTLDTPEQIAPVADFGVVLLMFMIGLELSFERLALMRRLVFGLGLLQIACCAAALAGALMLAGVGYGGAAILGLALAMSSTAVVLQVLADGRALNRPHGRATFAVLLGQDLAVVPVLFAVGQLAPGTAGDLATFGLAMAYAVLAVIGIIVLGRVVLRPVFRSVARTGSPDLFTATCLLVVLATGLATAVAGLSMAMGALIAGLLLAETEYRRQVEMTIAPFKGLLVGVFLVSIGMSLELGQVVAQPGPILLAVAAMLGLKLAVTGALARGFGLGWADSLRTGLMLAPGGEFGFVILGMALELKLVAPAEGGLALIVAALTMAMLPLLGKLSEALPAPAGRSIDPALSVVPHATAPRVIVAGFGRVGQTVAGLLETHGIPYLAVDRDPDWVARQRKAGRPVVYGDMAQTDLLHHLDLDQARALVVTIDHRVAADAVVTAARETWPDLLIVARARDAAHAVQLYASGATDAVPEAVEASLQLSEALLVSLGVPMGPVIASIHARREELQSEIKAQAPREATVRALGRRRLRDAAPPRPAAAEHPPANQGT